MITIKDIAKEAKVSEGTVDRVIHKRSGVSKKTEAKVKKILERHNFSVNPVARALAMKNKHLISILIPEYNDSDLFWNLPNSGILKAAKDVNSFGIEVNSFAYNQYDPLSYFKTFKALLKTKPSAVIMVPNFSKETQLIVVQLEALNIPYLFLNIDIKGFNNMTYVGQDSYTAGYIAGKLMHLKNPKPSKFLIIQSRHNITKNNAVSKRIEGFNDYFLTNKINSKSQTLKIEHLNNAPDTKEKINTYLKTHAELKGLFVPSSRIYDVVECIEPVLLKKINLIGFDNTPQNIECLLNDTVSFLISQKPFDQGYESVRVLADYLIYNKIPSNKIYLPIDILIKENVNYNMRKESHNENKNDFN
ncbi:MULTISPECIES: substrate-binding domain-containing protein [unclassified Polaribacter]|uniref:substrate-binding domain-containing protein n=1 Tax=unclassified Polaribacter TaxID=196858 RepID=UPI0011BF79B9|nr:MULTISPECIES: substrate-binding domain-containing protein [unclassified Polaribacter]TXD50423.1 substrate-binding domain-containing protein [Polaribacter sp. IC063]TXD57809.1 substrate-binding domain-containing protein [Polaribacter sp. IC066]